MSDKSIVKIDFNGMSKVGVALIEKVSDAIGGLYKPNQIVRLAKAQAKSDLITAKSDMEIDQLKKRALDRLVSEEAKKQSNIEEITKKSIPHLEDSSDPNKLDDDWITNFFEKCRVVSNDDMQLLWSMILAGEVNAPGKFSRRTINLLSDLDHNDAKLFNKLCGFLWSFGTVCPFVFDVNNAIYADNGINFLSLSHLDSLGLVHFSTLVEYKFVLDQPHDAIPILYYGRKLVLVPPPMYRNELPMGHVMLTNAGMQLARVSGCTPVPGFYEYVKTSYQKRSFKFR